MLYLELPIEGLLNEDVLALVIAYLNKDEMIQRSKSLMGGAMAKGA
jgi:hypothetical protein